MEKTLTCTNHRHWLFLLILFPLSGWATQYHITPPQAGARPTTHYFNQQGVPDIHVSRNCNKYNLCTTLFTNQQGKRLARFSGDDNLTVLASSRYRNRATVLVEHSYSRGIKRKVDYFILTDRGKRRPYRHGKVQGAMLDSHISFQRQHVGVTRQGIVINGKLRLPAPQPLEKAILRNHPDGPMAALAIGKNGQILASNLDQWLDTGITLARHGDRSGILGIYPVSHDQAYAVVYHYINPYNKGLRLAHIDFQQQKVTQGWLFNSEKDNIGFDPDIYYDSDTVIVSSRNATAQQPVHFTVASNEVTAIENSAPIHTRGFEWESDFSFMLGAGLAQLDWNASSSVKKDNTKYLEIDYDISRSLYKSVYLQGRWMDTQIAVDYLRNEAEPKGELEKKASTLLNLVVDFHGLFSNQSTLRIGNERADVNGVATPHGLTNEPSQAFVTRYQKYTAQVIKERGSFWGVQYANYQIPSAVGFSDSSKAIVDWYFDPEFAIESLSFIFGYDEMAYAKRYETQLRRFYLAGHGGIGLGKVSLSREIKQAATADGARIDSFPLILELDGTLEGGYLLHHRIKQLKGAGLTFSAGYRLSATYLGTGQGSEGESSLTANELALEFDRFDLWHGPFAKLALVY